MKNAQTSLSTAILIAACIALIGCESGGKSSDNSNGTGSSVITGNIASFGATGVATYMKAIQGATVSLVGTSISSSTGADGSFTLTGIPAGVYELKVVFSGTEASMQIAVPGNAIVNLSDLFVDDASQLLATAASSEAVTGDAVTQPDGAVDMVGTWSGTATGGPTSLLVIFNANGQVYADGGDETFAPIDGSYHVSGNSFTGIMHSIDHTVRFNGTVSGNTATGTWSSTSDHSGSFTITK